MSPLPKVETYPKQSQELPGAMEIILGLCEIQNRDSIGLLRQVWRLRHLFIHIVVLQRLLEHL